MARDAGVRAAPRYTTAMSDSAPAMTQINLVVADMARTVAFYRLLGLTIDDSHQWKSDHISIAMPNGFQLDLDSEAFASQWNPGRRPSKEPSRNVLGFDIDSREGVDQLVLKLERGGHRIQLPPHDAFWGARYAIAEDPDGNPVGIMSPIDPRLKTNPPA
jgi:catechol 2,3-dioxygenase-like lactoylglutathione lyase family enzyme